MYGKTIKILLIITLLAMPVQVLASGTQAADFLNIDVSALQASFGGANAALSNDITSGYYNPAGLSSVGRSGVNFMHNLWYQDISYEFLGGAFALNNKSTIAVSTAYLHMGDIIAYDESNQVDGSISAYSLAGIVSYSYSISPNLSLGLGGKYISEKLDNTEATGYAFDLGLQYHRDYLSFGAVVNNLGPKMKYESDSYSIPTSVSLGASYEPFQIPGKILLGAKVPFNGKASFATGVEYDIMDFFAVRTGVGDMGGDNASHAFNIGAGFEFSGINVDYAFNPGNDLGSTHFFSFNFSFGKPRPVIFDSRNQQFSGKGKSIKTIGMNDIDGVRVKAQTYVISTGNFESEQIAGFHVETLKEFGVDGLAESKPDGTYRVVLSRTDDQKSAERVYDKFRDMGIAVNLETE